MVDVIIICALFDEYQALLNTNTGENSWKKEFIDGWSVATTILNTSSGPLSIMATWQNFMGREQAISATTLLLQKYNTIRCICMTGICAGRKGKVHLGDVIFADRLWSYDNGKSVVIDGIESFQGDHLQFKPNNKILQRMQSFQPIINPWISQRPKYSLDYQEKWLMLKLLDGEKPENNDNYKTFCPSINEVLSRLRVKEWINHSNIDLTESGKLQALKFKEQSIFGLQDDPDFKVHVAPIATGGSVKEDKNIFDDLSDRDMRKVLGIDMEASALGALGEILNIPVIIAKAVSDYGDNFKDDTYRHFSSRAAAECMIQLIMNCADIILDNEQKSFEKVKTPVNNNELIDQLSSLYYDINSIRALWVRSGGKPSDISNINNISDLWFDLIFKASNGSIVTIKKLVDKAVLDFPQNDYLKKYID